MPSHQLAPTSLKTVTAETLVKLNGNELIDLWKSDPGLDIWREIGLAALAVKNNRKINAVDKLEALVKVGELALKIKRAGVNEKGGAVQINVVTVDPTKH